MRLGAHLSTAGGLHTSFARGEELGCTVIQIFLSSPRQWRGRDLSEEDVARFGDAWRASACEACFAHDIYLTRLGSRDRTIRRKSRTSLVGELRSCGRLGLDGLVVHPAGDAGAARPARVLERVARSLDVVLEESDEDGTPILLETTAGQGATSGTASSSSPGSWRRPDAPIGWASAWTRATSSRPATRSRPARDTRAPSRPSTARSGWTGFGSCT